MSDRIKVTEWMVLMEEIGVRSTRLRTLEGRLITVPNDSSATIGRERNARANP